MKLLFITTHYTA